MLTRTLCCVVGIVLAAPAWASADQGGSSDLPSFASLVTDLPKDVARLPSIETAVIIGTAAGVGIGVHGHDRRITQRMDDSLGSSHVFDAGAVVGELSVQLGAGLTTFVAGRVAHSPRLARLGADLVRAQVLNAAVTHGVKAAVDRRRPDGGPHSFPSGHTSSTVATAAVIQRHFGWKAGLPAYGLAAYTSASRLVDSRHFLSDVVAGAAVGATIGRAVSVKVGPATVVMVPSLRPGSIGITASIDTP